MFTYICEKCGREVPPAYSECPDCSPVKPAAPAATPAPPSVQASAVAAPPPQPQTQVVYVKRGVPGWLVGIGVAILMMALGAVGYYNLPSVKAQRQAAEPVREATIESPAAPKPAGEGLARHLEITGMRIVEQNKKAHLQFVIVNHSNAELAEIAGTLVVSASGTEVTRFPVKVGSLGPYELKEMSAPMNTKLRAYEMPDWQFLKAALEMK